MQSSKTIDMTRGHIMRLVVLFALPICAGNILQQLYNTVDTLVIGNFCGTVSLAAVGTSAQPVEMLLCIFLGLGLGVSILVSQCVGRGDQAQLKATVATASSFLYLCAVPVALLGPFIGPLILRIMHVPAEAWDYCVAYVDIIFLGSLGNMGYNMNAGILRGLGDSRSPLLFLAVSCLLNIVLDLLFVAVFGLDVPGAALATALAMCTSWVFSVFYIRKRYPELELGILPRRIDRAILLKIVRIGLPLGLNNSIYSIGHILMQTLVNQQGAAFIAGCSVATKLTGIANIAITSFSSAATTFAGQNLGAQRYRRLRTGSWQIPLTSGIITCCGGLLVALLSRPIIEFFTHDPEVIQVAVLYVTIVLPLTWPYAVFNGIISFVNGMGEVRYPTVINMLMLWAVRIPCAYLIAWLIDGTYIMACFPISFLFGMSCMLAYYRGKRWKQICRLADAEKAVDKG